MTCYTYQSVFRTQSAVCSLHFVLTGLDYCFCSSEPQVGTEILELEKNFSKTILAAMIRICGMHIEELPRKSTMMEQRLLYTN